MLVKNIAIENGSRKEMVLGHTGMKTDKKNFYLENWRMQVMTCMKMKKVRTKIQK